MALTKILVLISLIFCFACPCHAYQEQEFKEVSLEKVKPNKVNFEERYQSVKLDQDSTLKARAVKYGINNSEMPVISNLLYREKIRHKKTLKMALSRRRMKIRLNHIGPTSLRCKFRTSGSGSIALDFDFVEAYDIFKSRQNPYTIYRQGLSRAVAEGFGSIISLPSKLGSVAYEVKDAVSIVEEEV